MNRATLLTNHAAMDTIRQEQRPGQRGFSDAVGKADLGRKRRREFDKIETS